MPQEKLNDDGGDSAPIYFHFLRPSLIIFCPKRTLTNQKNMETNFFKVFPRSSFSMNWSLVERKVKATKDTWIPLKGTSSSVIPTPITRQEIINRNMVTHSLPSKLSFTER